MRKPTSSIQTELNRELLEASLMDLLWSLCCGGFPWPAGRGHWQGDTEWLAGDSREAEWSLLWTHSWLSRVAQGWPGQQPWGWDKAFRVSSELCHHHGHSVLCTGTVAGWVYSCCCHMLQVKVIMLGWIPLITNLVSVDSHSWLFWSNNSWLPPWIQRTEWQLGLEVHGLALRTCSWWLNHQFCYWDPLLWHPLGAECSIFSKHQLWENTSLSCPAQGRQLARPSWAGKEVI